MAPYQWLIVGIRTFINALEGYDVLVIAFASNQVTEEFSLSGTALGHLGAIVAPKAAGTKLDGGWSPPRRSMCS